jgi:hypothetical protein
VKEQTSLFLLGLPLAVCLIAGYTATKLKVQYPLTSVENTVAGFRPNVQAEQTAIKDVARLEVPQNLSGPLRSTGLTATGTTVAVAPPVHKVTAITITERVKKAIINDRIVHEGDRLNGSIVSIIQPHRVAIKENGVTTWLVLEDSP